MTSKIHPYDNYSSIYNLLFHPLHKKKKAQTLISVITNTAITIFTGGLWLVPLTVVNRLDHGRLKIWKKQNTNIPTPPVSPQGNSNPQNTPSSKDTTETVKEEYNSQNNTTTPTSKAATDTVKKEDDSRSNTSTPTPPQPSSDINTTDSLTPGSKTKIDTDETILKSEDVTQVFPNLLHFVFDDTWARDFNSYAYFIDLPKFSLRTANLDESQKLIQAQNCIEGAVLDMDLQIWLQGSIKWMAPNKLAIDAIEERIKILNESIQLEERLKKLNPNVKIRDLFVPWEKSPLRYALISDDEMKELKISDIQEEPFLTSQLSRRILALPKHKAKVDLSSASDNDIQKWPLTEIGKLSSSTFEALAPRLPNFVFSLISISEIPNIKISLLSDQQLNCLFLLEESVEALSLPQVHQSLNRVEKKLLDNLSKPQIEGLDLGQINQPLFNAIFRSGSKTRELIHKFGLPKIYQIMKYFSTRHWEYREDEQIARMDFSKINKPIFDALFVVGISRTTRLIQSYKLDRVYELIQYFELSHWKELSEDQILKLDFSKINKPIFDVLFPHGFSRTKKLIQTYKLDRVYELIQYFELSHWEELSEDQILKLDFSKINKPIFDVLFPHGFSRTKKLIQNYKLDRVYELIQYFTPSHWEDLREDQILKLDFSKINKPIFDTLFPQGFSRTKKLIQNYKLDRVYELIQYFTPSHWEDLSDSQILDFDFSKINKPIFDMLFPDHRSKTKTLLNQMSDSQLVKLKDYIGPKLIKLLSDRQKELIK